MYLKENNMMERRIFLNKIVRWGTVVILAGITLLLGRKIVTGKDCPSCPEYAGCPGIDRCTIQLAGK
jgi:hypothetical protein